MTKQKKTKRVGEIEFLRFIFCIIIVFTHTEHLFDGDRVIFKGGSYAVEFFLLVSGYLFMMTMSKLQDKPINNLGKETLSYILHKVKPIYLDILLAYIVGFTIQCIAKGPSFETIFTLFKRSVFEILLVQRTGLGENAVNSVVWYIQSMLLCFAILYPLVRKYPKIMKSVVIPLIAMLLLGWLMMEQGSLRAPSRWLGLTFKGNIRTMAGLCAGACCYQITQRLKNLTLTVFSRLLMTISKWVCWLAVLQYTTDLDADYDDFYLLVMCVALVLTFSQQCIDTRIFQNKLSMALGRFSLPLYLNHIYLAYYLPYWLPKDWSQDKLLTTYLIGAFICATILTILAFILRKSWPLLKKIFSPLFIKRKKSINGGKLNG